MTGPTQAGFLSWIRTVMGVPVKYLPDDWPAITWAYETSLATVNPAFKRLCGPPSFPQLIYTQMVYNLGADNLVNWCPDVTTDPETNQPIWYIQPDPQSDPPIAGQGYFSYLRSKWNLDGFVGGIVTATADEGTSTSLTVPESLKNLTLLDLQNLKTPWGRQYLAYAQQYGTAWGLS